MLGNLYKITNNVNNKVYVGKTYKSLEERFSRHKTVAEKEKHRKLYRAMLKHGFDNFNIELIGVFEEIELEKQEQEHIAKFNSFKEGYNSTLGGDGRRYCQFSDNEIIDCFNKTGVIVECAKELEIDRGLVRQVLHNNNIFPDTSRRNEDKIVVSSTLKMQFSNTREAALYLIKEGISTASLSSTEEGIRKVCRGARGSYKSHSFNRIHSE